MRETGGEIIVRTSADDECVQVDIADTGHGIESEKIGRVFEPYFTTKKTGSGLGLATTRRIIEEHNGTIRCQSEVGKGTNFTVRIPLAAKT
jgi:signal transduction histidine kinase